MDPGVIPMRLKTRAVLFAIAVLPALLAAQAGVGRTEYTVTFPAPEHRWAQVEATFTGVQGALEARMSRSSPGRYAVHEFAKNVFDLRAFDGSGNTWTAMRVNPHPCNVTGHDGTVR